MDGTSNRISVVGDDADGADMPTARAVAVRYGYARRWLVQARLLVGEFDGVAVMDGSSCSRPPRVTTALADLPGITGSARPLPSVRSAALLIEEAARTIDTTGRSRGAVGEARFNGDDDGEAVATKRSHRGGG